MKWKYWVYLEEVFVGNDEDEAVIKVIAFCGKEQ